MNYKVVRASLIYGFIIWFIPFAVSFLFYDRAGEPLVDETVAGTVYVFAFFLLLLFFLGRFMVKVSDWENKNILLFCGIVFILGTILDFIFLVHIFAMPTIKFLLQVIPIYLLTFATGYFAIALKMCFAARQPSEREADHQI